MFDLLANKETLINILRLKYAMEEIDKLDAKILCILNENARLSLREIARKSHVSLSTIANRVKQMEKSGVIAGYSPRINPEKAGYELTALISLRIAHGKLMAVQQKISADSRVHAVYDITGDWDSLIIGRFHNRAELNKFIKSLLSTEHIERTSTSIALNVIKDEPRIIV